MHDVFLGFERALRAEILKPVRFKSGSGLFFVILAQLVHTLCLLRPRVAGHGRVWMASWQRASDSVQCTKLLLPLRQQSIDPRVWRLDGVQHYPIWPSTTAGGAACHPAHPRLFFVTTVWGVCDHMRASRALLYQNFRGTRGGGGVGVPFDKWLVGSGLCWVVGWTRKHETYHHCQSWGWTARISGCDRGVWASCTGICTLWVHVQSASLQGKTPNQPLRQLKS